MLLFRKPLADIQIGETFPVTVMAEDWEQGDRQSAYSCALALALRRNGGAMPFVTAFSACFGSQRMAANHDGASLVTAFDAGDSFELPAVVTFTRHR